MSRVVICHLLEGVIDEVVTELVVLEHSVSQGVQHLSHGVQVPTV